MRDWGCSFFWQLLITGLLKKTYFDFDFHFHMKSSNSVKLSSAIKTENQLTMDKSNQTSIQLIRSKISNPQIQWNTP